MAGDESKKQPPAEDTTPDEPVEDQGVPPAEAREADEAPEDTKAPAVESPGQKEKGEDGDDDGAQEGTPDDGDGQGGAEDDTEGTAADDAAGDAVVQEEKAPPVDAEALFPGVSIEHPVELADMEDGTQCAIVDRDDLFTAVRSVKDQGYRILSCLSASDDKKGPMEVFYAFVKPAGTAAEFGEFRIKVRVPKTDAGGNETATTCPSIVDLFKAADWQEREQYDMYGIVFEGHPDLRRMFLPEAWTGFPMRKDYDEPEQFVAMREGEDIVLKEQEEGSW